MSQTCRSKIHIIWKKPARIPTRLLSCALAVSLAGSMVIPAAAEEIIVDEAYTADVPEAAPEAAPETAVTESAPEASPETVLDAALEAAPEYEETEMHSQFYYNEVDSNSWDSWPFGPAIEAQSAIVMEFNSGAVLYEKASDTKLYPASITKIMTTLLACENNSMDKEVVISENAVHNISEDSSSAYLEPGEKLNMEQLLMAVMLQSANDAAYQAAEETSGSMKKFVELMNLRVRQLGCTSTHFNNPHGLHSQYHYTTARDMATIARYAWKNARFRSFANTVTYDIPPTNKNEETRYYLNNHKMMKTEVNEYEGVLGGKTGYTDEAGNTLVTVAQRGSLTVVVVVLNGIGGAYSDTAALLDYAFANFANTRIDTLMEQPARRTLFADQMLLRDGIWPSVLQATSRSYVTLPKGVSADRLVSTAEVMVNSPCADRIRTSCYYGGHFVGSCICNKKEVLPDLLKKLKW